MARCGDPKSFAGHLMARSDRLCCQGAKGVALSLAFRCREEVEWTPWGTQMDERGRHGHLRAAIRKSAHDPPKQLDGRRWARFGFDAASCCRHGQQLFALLPGDSVELRPRAPGQPGVARAPLRRPEGESLPWRLAQARWPIRGYWWQT